MIKGHAILLAGSRYMDVVVSPLWGGGPGTRSLVTTEADNWKGTGSRGVTNEKCPLVSISS